MAFQIHYYLGASSRMLADSDQIGDVELTNYPIPAWPEWISVRNVSTNEVLYGYGDRLHKQPPREMLEHERRQKAERESATLKREIAKLPTATVESADWQFVVVLVGHHCEVKRLSWGELDNAAEQDDRTLRVYYAAIRRTARAMLRDRTLMQRVEVYA